MKPVIKIDAKVHMWDAQADKTEQGELNPELDDVVRAIDERAHYISPVLDHLLHIGKEVPKWLSRE